MISLQVRREIRRASLRALLHQRPAQSARRHHVTRYETLPHVALLALDTPCLDARVLLEQQVAHVAVVLTLGRVQTLTTVCLSTRRLLIT